MNPSDLESSPILLLIGVGALFAVISYAATGLNEVLRFIDRFRTKPEAREQVGSLRKEIDAEFATKAELDNSMALLTHQVGSLATSVDKLVTTVSANEAKQEGRAVALHHRLDETNACLGKTNAQLARHSGRLFNLREDRG